jgi:glycine/D-amino acid oxidase-like deaminating enzyme
MNKADPGAYGSSWLAATKVASAVRSPLAVELDVEVCVIGAGLAGLTVAREVARRGWSVVVLEAQSVAWNASGRNAGFVLPGYAAGAKALVTRVGVEDAKKLWALSEAGAEYVRRTVQELSQGTSQGEQMPGVALNESGWLHVAKTDDERAMQGEAELLAGELGAHVEFQSGAQVREQLRSPLYFSGLHYPRGFSLHSLNYALGLAAAAERDGARIYENSAALEIDPAGVRKRVTTKDSRVRAHHVVLAGNIQLAELMPQFGNTLLPVHTYVIVTAPLGEAVHEAVRFPGAVSDTDLADNHYCVVEGDRLMWSGRSTVWRGRPQDYVGTLLGQITRTFPQLKNVKAEYAWTGLIGNTVHRMPQIGEITPGLWLLSGFGTRGLNTTAMGGEIVARAIVEGDRTWQMFSPFALVWSGGVYGRVAQQVSYWSNRVKERFVIRTAERREERRLREQDDSAPAITAVEPDPASAPSEPVALASAPAEPAPEAAVAAPAADGPPVIAAEDAPEVLLQPIRPATADPAKSGRGKPKKKREANPAGEGPATGGG